jgi:hypothetical protein
VSEDAAADADAYVLDAESFGTLRRLVGRLRGDGPLVGEERRNLASRMNALLQKAQPDSRRPGRPKGTSGHALPPDSPKDRFWTQQNQPFGKT